MLELMDGYYPPPDKAGQSAYFRKFEAVVFDALGYQGLDAIRLNPGDAPEEYQTWYVAETIRQAKAFRK